MNPILSSWNAEPPPGNSARIISSIYTKQLTSDTLAFMTRSLRHNPSRHPNVKNTLVALAIFFTFIFGNAASAADDNPDFLKPDTNIVFLGDSITQGGTYIAYINAYLWSRYPDRQYNLINLGLGSETASGLSEPDHPFPRPCIHTRIDRALAESNPDLTFICYGMNDGIYYPPSEDRMLAYKEGMTRLIEKVRATGSTIILLTPPPFDAETRRLKGRPLLGLGMVEYSYKAAYQDYAHVLKNYSDWILQEELDIDRVIDIHTPLENDIAEHRLSNPAYEYGDGIHPNERGHFVFARTILEGLNAPGVETLPNYSDLPADSPISKAMPLILKRHNSYSAAWREHVGHSKPNKESVPSLKEATRQAQTSEVEIRRAISSPIAN
jgi:lysophospholipase L1-like esterase